MVSFKAVILPSNARNTITGKASRVSPCHWYKKLESSSKRERSELIFILILVTKRLTSSFGLTRKLLYSSSAQSLNQQWYPDTEFEYCKQLDHDE